MYLEELEDGTGLAHIRISAAASIAQWDAVNIITLVLPS
jgi:hypothetical protein